MSRDQGLPFLDINCEQKFNSSGVQRQEKTREKDPSESFSVNCLGGEGFFFFLRGGVYV